MQINTKAYRRRLDPLPAPKPGAPMSAAEFRDYLRRTEEIRLFSLVAIHARAHPSPPGLQVLYIECLSGTCGRCHTCKPPATIPIAFR